MAIQSLHPIIGETDISSARRPVLLFVIIIALALILSACSSGIEQVQAEAITDNLGISQLRDLDDIEDLSMAFNQDIGKPRIILLLSPT